MIIYYDLQIMYSDLRNNMTMPSGMLTDPSLN
jgi:hypothetical protein